MKALLLVPAGLAALAGSMILGVLVGRGVFSAPAPPPQQPADEARILTGALVNFDYRIENPGQPLDGAGGGLAADGGGIYISRSQAGVLQRFDIATRRFAPVRLALPDNNFAQLPPKSTFGRDYDKREIRYNDLEFVTSGGVRHLVASYTYYHPDRSCFTSRLAIHPLDPGWDQPLAANAVPRRDGWRIVHDTQPCLPFKPLRHPFSGQQAGGRIADDGHGSLYWTVGDHEFDGMDGPAGGPAYPQLAGSDYGKVLRFDTNDWSASIFTTGHRNQQGITVDALGRVWEVEHGPMGGDELNLLRAGGNYGWPLVTLGVNYTSPENDAKQWPNNPRQGRHDGYQPPVYAWVPSQALGNVKVIKGIDPRINGDLLVAGMGAQTLFRMRIEGERVLYAEPTRVTGRIRYAEIANGEIYLLLDDGSFATMRPRPTGDIGDDAPSADRGPALALGRCRECHGRPESPRLTSILGSAVATQAGVVYSPQLVAAGGVWSAERLRAFLSDPQAFAPGTVMPAQSLDAAEMDAILAALKPSPAP